MCFICGKLLISPKRLSYDDTHYKNIRLLFGLSRVFFADMWIVTPIPTAARKILICRLSVANNMLDINVIHKIVRVLILSRRGIPLFDR